VALHREESAIYTANLGDSGFRVVRAGKIVHRSQEQQHYFNTPFQLAVAPSDMQGLVLSDRSAAVQCIELSINETFCCHLSSYYRRHALYGSYRLGDIGTLRAESATLRLLRCQDVGRYRVLTHVSRVHCLPSTNPVHRNINTSTQATHSRPTRSPTMQNSDNYLKNSHLIDAA